MGVTKVEASNGKVLILRMIFHMEKITRKKILKWQMNKSKAFLSDFGKLYKLFRHIF